MWVAIHLYKNILFYTMLIGAVTRLISAGMLAMMGKINLPVELVILSLAIAFFGFVLVVKRQVFSIKLSEVVAYHVAGGSGCHYLDGRAALLCGGHLADRDAHHRLGAQRSG